MHKRSALLIAAALSLCACADMQPVAATGSQGYYWARRAERADTVVFRQRTPAEIAERLGRPALAGATVGGPVCVVDFSEPWPEVPAELLLHELRHCAGWGH